MIEERHNKYKEIAKKIFSSKSSMEREKYEISQEKYLLNKKLEQELKEEKAFKKYEGYVSKNLIVTNIYNYIFFYIVFFDEREKRKTE